MELPMLVQKCLTYGVKIYPSQLEQVLNQYELKKVPVAKLEMFNAAQTENYVKALYLCGEEMAKDWREGYEMLKELGFKEQRIDEGHRVYTSLIFNDRFNPIESN